MFRNRVQAGQRLAVALDHYRDRHPLVLGLPRGGVPVAAEVARALRAPLDVVVVRKLGAPSNPEYAFGAVGEGGALVVDREVMRRVGVDEALLQRMVATQEAVIRTRGASFRDGRPMPSVHGRTVIVVDDGLATGSTASAAIAVLRKLGAGFLVLAVPVGAVDTVARLRSQVDDLVCLEQPIVFYAVGEHYEDFTQTTDEEVVALLQAHVHDDVVAEARTEAIDEEVSIPVTGYLALPGNCTIPASALGVVAFAHGSGSSRHSPRNLAVARRLNDAGIGTLLFDLLTDDESLDRRNVFDIELLASRLTCAKAFLVEFAPTSALPIGYFGASTGAAAALVAAASDPQQVRAVVSRGGRPDLAGAFLPRVQAPTLLIVGGHDYQVIGLNEQARAQLRCASELVLVPGATHLFEEPGTLQAAAGHARDWFVRHLPMTG